MKGWVEPLFRRSYAKHFIKKERLSSFFKFIRTIVIHLTAKRALERHSHMTKGLDVNISLISMERSALCFPSGSWLAMKGMMRESLLSSEGDTNTDVDKAVEILQKIQQAPADTCSSESIRLLGTFKSIIDNERVLFSGGLHCETVLATLHWYSDSLPPGDENSNLISTCKVLLFTFLPAQSDHLS